MLKCGTYPSSLAAAGDLATARLRQSALPTYRRFAQVVVPNRAQTIIELVHQRNAGGDIHVDDVGIADVIEMLHECSQGVAMGRDNYAPPRSKIRHDAVAPVRQEASKGVFERLTQGQLVWHE